MDAAGEPEKGSSTAMPLSGYNAGPNLGHMPGNSDRRPVEGLHEGPGGGRRVLPDLDLPGSPSPELPDELARHASLPQRR